MRQQPFRTGVAIALVLVCVMVPSPAHAQRRGLSITGDLEAARPALGQREADFWRNAGTFGAGVGADVGIDYDWSRFGLSVEANGARTSVGGLPGDAFGLAMLLNWHPNVALDGWRPRVAVGYLAATFGDVSLVPGQIRMDFLDPPSTGGSPSQVENTTMYGDGTRLVLAADRTLNDWSALRVLLGADFVYYGQVNYGSVQFTLRNADMSSNFRLGVGLRIHPRWGHSPGM